MTRAFLTIALLGASIAATTAVHAQPSRPAPVGNPKGIMASWTAGAEESYAKSAIQSAGFDSVSELTRSQDGTWHAHALKNNVKVDVSLDRAGRVTAN